MAVYGMAAILAICVLVLCIGVLKKRAQLVFRFLTRTALGLVGIYFFNAFLEKQEISLAVGLNPATALTVGILGFCGFALLYGIMLYRIL